MLGSWPRLMLWRSWDQTTISWGNYKIGNQPLLPLRLAALAAIFVYESLPSQSTYSRFFGKFSQARNTAVFPPLQQ